MSNRVHVRLNDGNNLPGSGFGTWQLADGDEAKESVREALKAGYRLIDTASIYSNERSVGEAIKQSGIKREEICVTTKLWNNDQGYESAHQAFEESLEKLGLDWIDLYLIHWPGHDSHRRLESWRALEEIKKSGRAKSIGVSNFEVNHLEELAANSSTVPAVNQIELHPFVYERQLPILEACSEAGIIVEAYSPLARGKSMDNDTVSSIAQTSGRTNAQVMLRWAIQIGTVPLPKSAHPQRIKENLHIFDFELSKDDMMKLNSLGGGKSSLPFYVKLLK